LAQTFFMSKWRERGNKKKKRKRSRPISKRGNKRKGNRHMRKPAVNAQTLHPHNGPLQN